MPPLLNNGKLIAVKIGFFSILKESTAWVKAGNEKELNAEFEAICISPKFFFSPFKFIEVKLALSVIFIFTTLVKALKSIEVKPVVF